MATIEDMDPTIKAQWVAALRSGDYIQGRGQLTNSSRDCCLGVLCKLAVANGVDVTVETDDKGTVLYDGLEFLPPASVVTWAFGSGEYDRDSIWSAYHPDLERDVGLPDVNDNGASFAAIADLIENA